MVGYDTVQEMVLDTLNDADKHLEMMVNFILAAKLDDELRAHNWTAFARGYNGPQHAKHDYAGRLRRAYARWARIADTPWSPEAEIVHVPVPTPAPRGELPSPIGHNGGQALTDKPLTPIEQMNKPVQGAKAGTGAGAAGGVLILLAQSAGWLPIAWEGGAPAVALGLVVGGACTLVGNFIGGYPARDKRFQAGAAG